MVTIVVADGVYKAGFAASQEAYQEAVTGVFDGLDRVEAILKEKPYLCGDDLTEADIRLYVTVVSACSPNVSRQPVANVLHYQVRFDPVYVGHFKCNVRTIRHDYPNIHLQVFAYYNFVFFLLTESSRSSAGCAGCIGRMTPSSLPPTLTTSRHTTIGRTPTYVQVSLRGEKA